MLLAAVKAPDFAIAISLCKLVLHLSLMYLWSLPLISLFKIPCLIIIN